MSQRGSSNNIAPVNAIFGSNSLINENKGDKSGDYIPKATSATLKVSMNNLASESNDTSHKSAVENDYKLRSAAVTQSRYRRTLEHLSKFMRIQVTLDLRKSSGEKATYQLPILIDREKSIHDLAKHVEAEYAFMNLHESIASTNADPEALINSIEVIMIYDIGNVPLKFSSSVAEVLNNGDKAHVVATFIHNVQMKELIQKRCQIFTNLSNGENLSDAKTMSKWTYEAKMFALFHNLVGIQAFQDYCMQEFEIENLLFWLEVEVFRGICRQSLPDMTVSTVDQSNPMYPRLLLHARYIYYTFLAPESSLRLNVPPELIASIDWPLPKLDLVTGLHIPLRLDMWDEIQEHVFLYMSLFVYPRFEGSESYQDWAQVVNSKFDYPNAERGWFHPGDHHVNFQQDVEGMERAVREALTVQNTSLPVSEQSASRMSRRNSTLSQMPAGTKISQGASMVNTPPNDADLNDLPPEFYGQGPRITNAQRIRRIQREKKLKKFFGDAPIQKDPFADVLTAQFNPNDSNLVESNSDEILSALPVEGKNFNAVGDEAAAQRKKKAEKLGDFFGTKLPPEQLFEQKLVDKIEAFARTPESNVSAKTLLRNELDPQTKVKLLQKKKKLRGVLGDDVHDDLVRQSVRIVNNKSDNDTDEPLSPGGRKKSASSLSVDSFQSSLINVTDYAKKSRDENEYKRKKLDKIQQFLGEKITSKMVEKAAQPTTTAPIQQLSNGGNRLSYIRRLNKLQNMFGELPPSQIVAQGPVAQTSTESVLSILELLGGETVVSYLLSHESEMRELLQVMEDFDRQEGYQLTSEAQMDQGEFDEDDDAEDQQPQYDQQDPRVSGSLVKKVNQARQRRRIGKLTRFFGSPAGAISSELSTEEKVIEDVARHFKSLMDPSLIKQLTNPHPIDPSASKRSATSGATTEVPQLQVVSEDSPGNLSSKQSTSTSVNRGYVTATANSTMTNVARGIVNHNNTPTSSKTNVARTKDNNLIENLQQKLSYVSDNNNS